MNRSAELASLFLVQGAPSVVEFLEREIHIPRKMSPRQPGPFRTTQRPMMRPILECWSPRSGVNFCTVVGATQLLKTTVMCLGVSYRIKHSPGPTLIMGPSEGWTKTEISEKRLTELINHNAILAIEKPSDSDLFKSLSMDMSGGTINLVGANSPTALSGGTYLILAIEEAGKIQHFEHEDAPEGHPIENAFERTKDFEELAFHYMSGSPNISNHPLWIHYERGDQTHFWVPCPHCDEYFPFSFTWEKNVNDLSTLLGKPIAEHYRSVTWDQTAKDKSGLWNEEKVLSTAHYICPHNGCEITDTDKPAMLTAFEERRHNEAAAPNNRSFHLNSFLSPRVKFGRMAWKFLESQQDFFGLQTFYNSWLALCYELIKQEVKEDKILRLKADHERRTIPTRPALLVLTADPGQGMTHWKVTAILHTAELVVIDWGTVLTPEEVLTESFKSRLRYQLANSTEILSPQIGYMDSGYATNRVYDICASSTRYLSPRQLAPFWWPMKGSDARVGSWGESGIASHPTLKLYTYSDHQAKTELYGQNIGNGIGARIHLPKNPYQGAQGRLLIISKTNVDPDSFEALIDGLSGQKLITVGKYEVWKKMPRDHYGDCLKLAKVASWIARPLLLAVQQTALPQ